MSGNVSDQTWDWWGENYYSNSPATDPEGPSSGSARVNRGGSWGDYASNSRVADRSRRNPNYRDPPRGFRLSRTIP